MSQHQSEVQAQSPLAVLSSWGLSAGAAATHALGVRPPAWRASGFISCATGTGGCACSEHTRQPLDQTRAEGPSDRRCQRCAGGILAVLKRFASNLLHTTWDADVPACVRRDPISLPIGLWH